MRDVAEDDQGEDPERVPKHVIRSLDQIEALEAEHPRLTESSARRWHSAM